MVGTVGAYSIAIEPIAYIASMFFGILFWFVLIPVVLILFGIAVIAAIQKKMKCAGVIFMSSLLLPVFFIGGLKIMEAVGLARYKTSGLNEMRPLGLEPNGSFVVVYNQNVPFEEREKFSNKYFFPWEKDIGFTHESGVCELSGFGDVEGRTIEKIFFCPSATDEQKENLRTILKSAPIVYTFFENISEAEAKGKLEQKKTDKKL